MTASGQRTGGNASKPFQDCRITSHADSNLRRNSHAGIQPKAVQQVPRTAFYFIPSAMTGFIVNVFPFRNRVSSKEAFEGLELGEGKLSRPVLRGPGGRKAAWLLGDDRRFPRSRLLGTNLAVAGPDYFRLADKLPKRWVRL